MPIIRRPKIPPIEDTTPLTTTGLPSFLSDHIEELLKLSALECYTWDRPQIMSGKSPLTFKQACEDLKLFDARGIYAMAPSVIQSPLSKDQMVLLCVQLFTSEWYVKRELTESGLRIPDDMLIPMIKEMTTPNRKMSDYEKQEALSYRESLLNEVK